MTIGRPNQHSIFSSTVRFSLRYWRTPLSLVNGLRKAGERYTAVSAYKAAIASTSRRGQVVQDLFAGHQPSGVGREQIQQTLLQGREMQLAGGRPHAPVQDINLQLAELDERVKAMASP